jgi:hypothetical protein
MRNGNAVKLAAVEHREKCLAQNAALFGSLHGFSSKNAAKAILAREKSSKQFRQLRSIMNPAQLYGLDQIDVPDQYAVHAEDESVIPRIPLVLGSDIEAVLLPHTLKCFRQHAETPFGAGKRSHRLGQDCTSEDAQSLLNGTYAFELDSLTPEALEWFKQFRMHQSVIKKGEISLDVSAKEWVQFWAKARESTLSSSSGIHYGHYKTASVLARLLEDHQDFSPVVAAFHASMVQLPLKHGFSLKRWRECTDAVLEENSGSTQDRKTSDHHVIRGRL